MRYYVAGPMRGIDRFNFPAFDQVKTWLLGLGHDVVSPADIDREMGWVTETPEAVELTDRFAFEKAIDRDLAEIGACDAMALLPGWERSEGARIELAEALRLGHAIWVVPGLMP